jgi:hypothetical protein
VACELGGDRGETLAAQSVQPSVLHHEERRCPAQSRPRLARPAPASWLSPLSRAPWSPHARTSGQDRRPQDANPRRPPRHRRSHAPASVPSRRDLPQPPRTTGPHGSHAGRPHRRQRGQAVMWRSSSWLPSWLSLVHQPDRGPPRVEGQQQHPCPALHDRERIPVGLLDEGGAPSARR